MTEFAPFDLHQTCLFIVCLVTTRMFNIILVKKFWFRDEQKMPLMTRWNYIVWNVGATPVTCIELEGAKSFRELGEKLKLQFKETLFLLTCHFWENILLVVPLFLTYQKISARHHLLARSVGVLPIEVESHENIQALLAACVGIVTAGLAMQSGLALLFSRYGSSWAQQVRQAGREQAEQAGRQS